MSQIPGGYTSLVNTLVSGKEKMGERLLKTSIFVVNYILILAPGILVLLLKSDVKHFKVHSSVALCTEGRNLLVKGRKVFA